MGICATALYDGEIKPTPFPRAVFIESIQMATSTVEFSFNDFMYRKYDGVVLGSLGPASANILLLTSWPLRRQILKSGQALVVLPIRQ